jgi:hypothetical protein
VLVKGEVIDGYTAYDGDGLNVYTVIEIDEPDD